MLICCAHILETKQHHLIAKEALTSDKRSFLLISFVQFDLIVTENASMKLNNWCLAVEYTRMSTHVNPLE